MGRNQQLGARGEDLAAEFLESAGMVVLERNWRCRYGELDLIARDGAVLVFVEVKTRTGLGYGSPAEAVTPEKADRIRRLAGLWLAEQETRWRRIRVDVVTVLVGEPGAPMITHLKQVL
ncbi:YraN family protein [Rhodococcus sp. HM1]|uniref:YraN family protein n=1 Tax=unclassified Rhodococcus (in: high G+C Gram-positive bacteria) TaxID=192944 RepID=UPI0018CFBCE5|nr:MULTISPECIES: YraN family protein [unclassified Rhodococcus (in: high G+C Gram-positive bacteria)]MBH0119284.1 YraN family protein [Rhodococcus sp. CX]MCK8670560.1 YraN family protein [Rhodococcus sp. HM1]